MEGENWYQRIVLPYLLDFACGLSPIRRQREQVVPAAHGRVLEIGIGTGLNLPFYDHSRVSHIIGLDPALRMHRLARRRIAQTGLPVELLGLSAESIPLPAGSIDTVLTTFTLCSIPDPLQALKEMRRVLAPGGRLLFAEHGKAPDRSVQRWQHRLQPYWGPIAGGCQLGRDIPLLLQQAGFRVNCHSQYLPGPRALSYHYWGQAIPV